MERVCFVGRVRAERLDEYRQRHETVWPDMLAALREAGWGNYSLFLARDGLLIGYLETDNYQAALDRMAQTDVNQRWQAEMATGPWCTGSSWRNAAVTRRTAMRPATSPTPGPAHRGA